MDPLQSPLQVGETDVWLGIIGGGCVMLIVPVLTQLLASVTLNE